MAPGQVAKHLDVAKCRCLSSSGEVLDDAKLAEAQGDSGGTPLELTAVVMVQE